MTAVSRRSKDGSMLGSLGFATLADKAEPFRARKDYSQPTFAKLRKVAFLPHSDRVIWLGFSEGRCVALWKRCDDVSQEVEPFDELFRLELDEDPCDVCSLSSGLSCVSLSDGRIVVLSNRNDELVKVREFSNIHGKGSCRVLCEFDGNNVISGSSNGSIAKVDVESGNSTIVSKGNSGVRSLCTLSGGTLLASGHSTGHVLIWDCRAKPTKPSIVCVPSKRRLDAVTTLTSHPAQASLLSFGTDLGTVGFCDVRGVARDLVSNSFDVATTTVTQVSFHPECGDHLVCASADGSLVHWDVSSVITTNVSSGTRQSPWLSESLSQNVELDTLRCPSFGAVNGFAIKGTTVVAAIDMCMLYLYENVSFPIGCGSNP
ncbi:WD domain G-beta repeat protein [Trichostrongylus colubriformis]|uniref:WD domain G-beta repeat protein n=1 Tax=Trichostrongylus colubriformis TaxID=6319 RepID=A0AAN8FNJ4_TRICO